MVVDQFPSVESAPKDGPLAFGGDLEVETLLQAYRSGIFPWPFSEEMPLAWFSPCPRGVLDFKNLHVPKSLLKFLKKTPLTLEIGQRFSAVIQECADSSRSEGQGTWITPQLMKAYEKLFEKGFAYSVEVLREGELVGGLYGVSIQSFLSGESMFFKMSNASKVALLFFGKLAQKKGISWMDTQMITPVVSSLGGREIKRSAFLKRLSGALSQRKSGDFLRKSHYCFEEVLRVLS